MLENLIRQFLYYPEPIAPDEPLPSYIRGAAEVRIATPRDQTVHGLYWPAPEGRPTILFFHGNAQTVFEWALIAEELAPLACGLLLIDYPGYGKSPGAPSEPANYDAGEGALQWLLRDRQVPPGQILIFGKSLGGGVACEIAQNRPVGGVILESTFTSIPAVLKHLIPFLPAGAALKTEIYDSLAKIPLIAAPVLVVHGTADDLIPVTEGQTLFAGANQPKQLYLVEGAGHADVSLRAGPAYGATLRQWIDKR